MDVIYEKGAALLKITCFEPRHIFENGQAFRFYACGGSAYEGVAYGRYLHVERRGEYVSLFPCTPQEFDEIWRRYFDLERDYSKLFQNCDDNVLRQGIAYGKGLRMLQQEPFETLISSIISANNHIKRIQGIIERLCILCGEPFFCSGRKWYRFPEAKRLAQLSEKELKECGSGYRAAYIKEAAQRIADGFALESLRELTYENAKKELRKLPGVGPKVADCILLFSLGFTDAFPADVWVKRILQEYYGFAGNDKQIYTFARERFGICSGIAQQYLFFWKREKEKKQPETVK